MKSTPAFVPDLKKLSDILEISLEEAAALKDDKPRLLRRLQVRIDELNEVGPTSEHATVLWVLSCWATHLLATSCY